MKVNTTQADTTMKVTTASLDTRARRRAHQLGPGGTGGSGASTRSMVPVAVMRHPCCPARAACGDRRDGWSARPSPDMNHRENGGHVEGGVGSDPGMSRPVRQASRARTTPKTARPANWTASKWASANSRALTTTATGTGVLPSRARSSRPRKNSSSTRGAPTAEEEQQDDDAADGVGGGRVAVRRLAQLVAQVAIEVLEGEVEERDQHVLAGQADRRADGQVPPGGRGPSRSPGPGRRGPVPGWRSGRLQPDRPRGPARLRRSPPRGWRPWTRVIPGGRLGDRRRQRRQDQPGREPGNRLAEPPAVTGGGRLRQVHDTRLAGGSNPERRVTRRSTCVQPCGARRRRA